MRWAIDHPREDHTNSLSSIQALKAREVKSQKIWSTLQAVNRLAKVANLTLYWIRDHVSQAHKKRVDKLAKAGLDAPWCKLREGWGMVYKHTCASIYL